MWHVIANEVSLTPSKSGAILQKYIQWEREKWERELAMVEESTFLPHIGGPLACGVVLTLSQGYKYHRGAALGADFTVSLTPFIGF